MIGLALQATLGAAGTPSHAEPVDKDNPRVEATLPPVTVRAHRPSESRDSVRAGTTTIGKGEQDLRDVPQSITVVTERLIDDRNLDTMRDVLRNTAGITFLAAEGGEEDIRLRGFALQSTGDVFVDGMRDPAFYDRDTFFLDRVEVLRGSASMLFGRGSTGGAVNQVNKLPRLIDEYQIDVTMGSHGYARGVADFNKALGASTAIRVGAMATDAQNNGAGTSLSKRGGAVSLRTGIGETHEFGVGLYRLENRNGINYGLPYIRTTANAPVADTVLLPLDPTAYYGMASDRNHGNASTLTASHTWRIDRGIELVTRVRRGLYSRDQRASTIRFAPAAQQPGGAAASLETFGPSTVITRGTQNKIQDMDTVFAQSDLSARFADALGGRHAVQAGIDYAQEDKTVYAALTAAQGGVVPVKPPTAVGMPDDGAWIDEDTRSMRVASRYRSKAVGLYVQDLVQVAEAWKVLVGLRYDHLVGDYDTFTIPTDAAGPTTATGYRMTVAETSKRVGLLYQPDERTTLHVSAATSFNTSGDAYSLSPANVDIPPEQSINVEVGGRFDSADGRFTARVAVFRSTKLHERNTDPLVNLVTLSGKRHVAGFEIDLAGRLTPEWEVFGSYMWLPVARIDEGVAGSEGEGTRPSLTPRHSGTLWTTYRVSQAWRVGGGLNARSGQSPNRNPGFYVPKYVTGDLLAEWHAVPDKVVFKANLNNVTDKRYADQLYTGHYVPGPGRTFYLTGTWRF